MDPDYDRDEDRAVARLLSGRDSLSQPEHESILSTVLEATAAEPAAEPAGVRWWWPAGFAALLAVGLAVWLLPNDPPTTEPEDAFVARGGSDGAPQLELHCEPTCRAEGRVALEVADAQDFEHVAVFSFREDGTVIWYAPETDDGSSARLPDAPRGLLPFQIEIDDAHPPGRYEVVAMFSKAPLDRAAVRAAYEAKSAEVVIVERTLEVLR